MNANPNAMVSAKGRLFYICDEAPATIAGLPDQWMLVARDAFNGMLLWKRPVPDWGWKAWSAVETGGRFNLPLHIAAAAGRRRRPRVRDAGIQRAAVGPRRGHGRDRQDLRRHGVHRRDPVPRRSAGPDRSTTGRNRPTRSTISNSGSGGPRSAASADPPRRPAGEETGRGPGRRHRAKSSGQRTISPAWSRRPSPATFCTSPGC